MLMFVLRGSLPMTCRLGACRCSRSRLETLVRSSYVPLKVAIAIGTFCGPSARRRAVTTMSPLSGAVSAASGTATGAGTASGSKATSVLADLPIPMTCPLIFFWDCRWRGSPEKQRNRNEADERQQRHRMLKMLGVSSGREQVAEQADRLWP